MKHAIPATFSCIALLTSGSALAEHIFSYDALGRVTEIYDTATNKRVCYFYDAAGNRIVTESKTGVCAINSPPIAANDSVSGLESANLDVFPLTNDSDPDDDPLALSILSTPPGISVSWDAVLKRMRGNSGNAGSYVVQYEISDGRGGSDTAQVTFNVTPSNSAPTANNDTAGGPESTDVYVFPLSNDSDPDGDPLTLTILSTPPGISVFWNATSKRMQGISSNAGEYDVQYQISDGRGGTDAAQVRFVITEPPGSCGQALCFPEE